MSSHHSQRFFNLHHQQVAGGRRRKQERIQERLGFFIEQRTILQAEARYTYLCGLFFSYLTFVYMAGISVVYSVYIMG